MIKLSFLMSVLQHFKHTTESTYIKPLSLMPTNLSFKKGLFLDILWALSEHTELCKAVAVVISGQSCHCH